MQCLSVFKRLWMVVLSIVFVACTAPTTMKSTWQDPTFSERPFERIAVLALLDSEAASREFEHDAAIQLRAQGIEVIEGRSSMSVNKDDSYEEMGEKLHSTSAEGILIFKLIAIDKDYSYRPPTSYVANVYPRRLTPFYSYYYPSSYYFPYWYAGVQVTENPGYWQEREYYVIESALYDNETDRLIWIATSKTYAPEKISELSESVLQAVSKRLREEHLIATR
jgi:hypothetical protein